MLDFIQSHNNIGFNILCLYLWKLRFINTLLLEIITKSDVQSRMKWVFNDMVRMILARPSNQKEEKNSMKTIML